MTEPEAQRAPRGGSYLPTLLAQMTARILMIGSTLAAFITVARVLGPESFGQYSYVVTFATLFTSLADFGTSAILARELSARRQPDHAAFWGTFIVLRLVLAAALVPVALVAAQLLRPDLLLPLTIVALALPVLALRFFEPLYQVYERPWAAVPPALAATLVYFGGTAAVLALGGDIVPLLAAYVAGNLAYALWGWRLAHRSLRPELRLRRDLARAILALALPMGVSTVFTSLNSRVGTFVLGELRSDFEVGIYNAAFRFLDFAAMGGVLLVTPLIPIFAHLAQQDPEGLRRRYAVLVEHLALALAPVVLSLPFVTPGLVRLCFGEAFAASAPVLDVLGVAAALVFFSLASSAVNVSLGVVRQGYWNAAVATSLNVALAVALVPAHGPVAAAWGALAAELAMLAISQFFTSRALGTVFQPGRWLAIGGLAAALGAWLHAVPLPAWLPPSARLGVGIAVYCGAIWWGGLVQPLALWPRRGTSSARP